MEKLIVFEKALGIDQLKMMVKKIITKKDVSGTLKDY
jgi:hypothetical protein